MVMSETLLLLEVNDALSLRSGLYLRVVHRTLFIQLTQRIGFIYPKDNFRIISYNIEIPEYKRVPIGVPQMRTLSPSKISGRFINQHVVGLRVGIHYV